MSLLSEHQAPADLSDRLRETCAMTAEFMSDIIRATCRRFPSFGQSGKTARIERLIRSGAWTDAAVALIDLELPQWQVRRLAYDQGVWYCALSRQRELPDWLDQSIEAHHADLALAILSAFVEAQRISAPSSRTSVPAVSRDVTPLYEPVICDNFGQAANELTSEFRILAQLPNLSRELKSTQVLIRFFLRIGILVIFAAFSSIGFGRALAALLWMSIVLCAVVGTMRREAPFGAVLNHWDETAAYAALFALVSGFNQSVPA